MSSMPDGPVMTVSELASHLGGTVEGDATLVIRSIASLQDAGPDSLSWVGSPEFEKEAAETGACAVLAPDGCTLPAGKTVIRVSDPDVALCRALDCFAPPVDRVAEGVHPSATVAEDAMVAGAAIGPGVYIGRGARIGPGTQLHPNVHVGQHTTIGRDCVLWPSVVVRERVCIQDRVIIHPNATIGADGFRYLQRGGKHLKVPQIGTVVIESDVEIGAGSCVDRARTGVTRIGRGTKLDNLVQIGHNVDVGEDCIIVAQCAMAGSVTLEDQVMVSGQSGVSDHVRIGRGARVAVKSLVMANVADGLIVRGIPAVEHHKFLREQASLRKISKWQERIRALSRRVEQLERKTNETAIDET